MKKQMPFTITVWIMLGLAFWVGSGPTIANQVLSPTQTRIENTSGANDVNITITNTGNQDKRYTLRIHPLVNPDDGTISSSNQQSMDLMIQPSEVILHPGESQQVQVSLRQQRKVLAGTYLFRLRAIDTDTTEEQGTSDIAVVIVPEIALNTPATMMTAVRDIGNRYVVTTQVDVDANVAGIETFLEVTPLQLLDRDGNIIATLPIDRDQGIEFRLGTGSMSEAGSVKRAAFSCAGDTLDGDATLRSESVMLHSAQPDGFRQPLLSTICWRFPTPMLPAGNYQGVVKVTAILSPDAE